MIISSIRFKNSGEKAFFNAFWTTPLAYSLFPSIFWEPKPIPRPKSFNWRLPILEVMITIVFLKSTFRPRLSVNCPSSNNCNRMLNTSGWAFSISSSNTTEYGLRRTFSVNCPPSSYPTYPGGAPTSRDTANFSMYSLMSIRINASSVSNK